MSYGKVNKSTGERIPYAGSAAAITPSAEYIDYDNTTSGLQADDVQDAIDELVSEKKDEYTTITYAQWQQLTPAQQAAKDYYISDYPSSQISAGNVSYNNSSSGMVANNVQTAVDELNSGLTNLENVVDVTNTMFSFNRDIGQNVYTADILLNNSNGVINVINDKKSGDTVVASMRLFLDVNNKSFKVGYYDGSNWQYETIKQFT